MMNNVMLAQKLLGQGMFSHLALAWEALLNIDLHLSNLCTKHMQCTSQTNAMQRIGRTINFSKNQVTGEGLMVDPL